jgi:prepilin peptidase CpaA
MMSSAVVLGFGFPAIWIDWRTHRIPNVLVAATLLGACAVQLGLHGGAGIALALGGGAVGLLGLLPLYLIGAMGAGDVKFMAALGALVGPATAVLAVGLTLLAGGALALVVVGWRRWSAPVTIPAGASRVPENRLPYAAAIVAGTLAATLIDR